MSLWGLIGWAQYGPGEGSGGLGFSFRGWLVTAGECGAPSQPHPGVMQIACSVPEGEPGILELEARRVPPGPMDIRVEEVPRGWPETLWRQGTGGWVDSGSPIASGFGPLLVVRYRFTPPPGSAGRTVVLRFRAWSPGAVGELELRALLSITGPGEAPSSGPSIGTTDPSGRFTVPVEELPDTYVAGTLTDCASGEPLAGVQVTAALGPRPGADRIRGLGDVGWVLVAVPDYGQSRVDRFHLFSSMTPSGRVTGTIDVGTVCVGPATAAGRTDPRGKFTVQLPGYPWTSVGGRLGVCGGGPLGDQDFTLRPLVEGGKIRGFELEVPGYAPVTVTRFTEISFLGLTTYQLGDVCLSPLVEAGPPHPEGRCAGIELRVLSLNANRLTASAKAVPAREREIMSAIKQGTTHRFDIVCLQEWFQDVDISGVTGLRAWSTDKGPLLRHWLGAEPVLDEVYVEGKVERGIRVIEAYPNNYGAEIVFGASYVAGPDCTRFLEARIDGGLVILVKPPYRIVAVSAFLFSATADWDAHASKGALYARVQLDPDDPDCYVHVFNTHLQADYPGKNYAAVRGRQIEELCEFIEKCIRDEEADHPIILVGDFNIPASRPGNWGEGLIVPPGVDTKAPVRSREYVLLTDQLKRLELEDVWASLRPGEPGFTWIGKGWRTKFPSPWGNLGNTLATEGGMPGRLDYIFVHKGADGSPIRLELLGIERLPESQGQGAVPYTWVQDGEQVMSFTLSDHLGLVLRAATK